MNAIKNLSLLRVIEKPNMKTLQSRSLQKVFFVRRSATKRQIKEALYGLFDDIKILRINTVNLPSKEVVFRGKKGMRSARKKAYVLLAPGHSIKISSDQN